jgi:hypothetical protein
MVQLSELANIRVVRIVFGVYAIAAEHKLNPMNGYFLTKAGTFAPDYTVYWAEIAKFDTPEEALEHLAWM